MRSTQNKSIYFIFGALIFIIFLLVGSKVFAGTGDNVFGSAWSENIGWISFNNCINPDNDTTCSGPSYGVQINHPTPYNDKISGYAWNDNVGWISFNPTDWGSCPPGWTGGGCSTSSFNNRWNSTNDTWARVLSACQDNYWDSTNKKCTSGGAGNKAGGWDGWISLNDLSNNKYHSSINWATDVSSNVISTGFTNSFTNSTPVYTMTGSSYGWGSDVIGWVDFNRASGSYDPRKGGVFVFGTVPPTPTTPTLALTVTSPSNKDAILAGNKATFHWVANNFTPTYCEGSGDPTTGSNQPNSDWKGATFTYSGTSHDISNITVPYDPYNENNVTTKFILTCYQGGSSKSANAEVTVTTIKNTTIKCNTNDPACNPNLPTLPFVTLNTNKTSVVAGEKVNLTWTKNNFTGTVICSGIGDTNAFADWKTTHSGSSVSGIHVKYDDSNISSVTTKFIIECTDGTDTARSSVSVNSVPLTATISKYNVPGCIAINDLVTKPIFDWSSNESSASCKILAVPFTSLTPFPVRGTTYTIPSSPPPFLTSTRATDSAFSPVGIVQTGYRLSCDSAASSYQSSVTALSASVPIVSVCSPDYDVVSSNSCWGSTAIGDDMTYDSRRGVYEGEVTLNLNAKYGFTSNVELSGGGGAITYSPLTGGAGSLATFTSPYAKTNSGSVGSIKVGLSLSPIDYNTMKSMSTPPLIYKATITATPAIGTSKNFDVNFCDGSGHKIKIKVNPI